jgi:hypothetical protein
MSLVKFQGKADYGFVITGFSLHIIFMSAFQYFAVSRNALDENHIRGCEYEIFLLVLTKITSL